MQKVNIDKENAQVVSTFTFGEISGTNVERGNVTVPAVNLPNGISWFDKWPDLQRFSKDISIETTKDFVIPDAHCEVSESTGAHMQICFPSTEKQYHLTVLHILNKEFWFKSEQTAEHMCFES